MDKEEKGASTSSWFGSAMSRISKGAAELAEVVMSETMKAKEEFMKEHEIHVGKDDTGDGTQVEVKLPWNEGIHASQRESVRVKILRLSKDSRTFLNPPPEDVVFDFRLDEECTKRARMLLDIDESLRERRYRLVRPKVREGEDKVTEFDFWRNYFYRVNLILEIVRATTSEEPAEISAPVVENVESASTKSADSWEIVPDNMLSPSKVEEGGVDNHDEDDELGDIDVIDDIDAALEMDFASEMDFSVDESQTSAIEDLKRELGLSTLEDVPGEKESTERRASVTSLGHPIDDVEEAWRPPADVVARERELQKTAKGN